MESQTRTENQDAITTFTKVMSCSHYYSTDSRMNFRTLFSKRFLVLHVYDRPKDARKTYPESPLDNSCVRSV